LARNSYFRELSGKEEDAVSVFDNRKIGDPILNNRVLITCDHAVNELKGLYIKDSERSYTMANDGFDPGAADFASYLSE
jgi:hypothetical protein